MSTTSNIQQTANNAAAQVQGAASAAADKVNQIAKDNTGKTVNEHGQTLAETATQFAAHVGDYAKGLVNLAGDKAAQAKEAADKTQVPGTSQQTLGGLVDESRNLLGKVLHSASDAIAGAPKATTEGSNEVSAQASSILDQARSTIATGLKKAEEVVAGTATSAQKTAEQAGEKVEPYTSNLMEGVKETSDTVASKANEVAKQ